MFLTLRNSDLHSVSVITATIGDSMKASAAEFFLEDPVEVFSTIRMLNDCDETGDFKGRGPRQPDGTYRGSKILPMPRSYCLSDSD